MISLEVFSAAKVPISSCTMSQSVIYLASWPLRVVCHEYRHEYDGAQLYER